MKKNAEKQTKKVVNKKNAYKVKENGFTSHKKSCDVLNKMINCRPITDEELVKWGKDNGFKG